MTTPDQPLPKFVDAPFADPFWEGTREGELRLQRCEDCEKAQFYPRPWCRYCGGDTEWFVASGEGDLYAYTVIRRVVEQPAFAEDIPYIVGYVDLEEGPRMFTTIVDCPVDEVENDMPVSVDFDEITDEVVLPKFRPNFEMARKLEENSR